MELKNLRTFKAVADAGGFAKAADALGYAQSTISVHIQQLERSLSVQLFERMGRRMVLTDVGEQVLQHARIILDSAAQLEEACANRGALTGTLRVSAAETVLCHLLGPVVRAFKEAAPQVRLQVLNKTCAQTPPALLDGTCDLGITYLRDWDERTFHAEELYWVEAIPVTAKGAPVDLAREGQHLALPFVTDEADGEIRQAFEALLKAKRITFEDTLEMWSTQAIKRCVEAGAGFTILPSFAMEEELRHGSLQPMAGMRDPLRTPLVWARRANKPLSPAMELFLRLTKEHLAQHPLLNA